MTVEGIKMLFYCHKRSPPFSKLSLSVFIVGFCLFAAGSQHDALVSGNPAPFNKAAASAVAATADVSTSSPIAAAVEAAAAAALGSISSSSSSSASAAAALSDDNGPKLTGGSTTRGASNLVIIQTTSAPAAKIVSVISHTQPSSVAPQPSASLIVHKLHKHNGSQTKKINIMDKLHKFDLFIDPVCERLPKLTEKQLSKVYLQLKQFSLHTNNALARCFADHGFPFTTLTMIRHQLGTFCTARSTLNEFYKQFSSCAEKIWSPLIETELDKIFKERINQGNKLSNSSSNKEQSNSAGELTNAELSLIDDIVAHLHDEQVQEIASELALEQQHGTPTITTTTTTTTTTTLKPAPAIVQVTQAPVQVHPTIGKLALTDAIDNSLMGAAAAAATAAASLAQQHQRGQTLPEANGKPANIAVIEIERQTVTTPAPIKASADNEASSVQRQLNALAGADSVIPQPLNEVSKPPQTTTLTLIESSSPPQQVAPIVVALPPTTSQPLIVFVETPPATQSPVLVVAKAAEQPTAFSPSSSLSTAAAAAVASAHLIQQKQLPMPNSVIQPGSTGFDKAAAGATATALAVGQSSAGASSGQDLSAASQLSSINHHQHAVDSAAATIVDTLKRVQDTPQTNNPLNTGLAQHDSPATVAAVSSVTAQPIGAQQAPITPAQSAAASTLLATTTTATTSPATTNTAAVATSTASIEPTNRSSMVEQAINLVSSGSAASVGAAANSAAPNVQPTSAPANQVGASSLANLMLKSIDLPATNAPAAPAAAVATSEASPPVNQPIVGAQAAATASAAALPFVGSPTLAPAVASIQEHPTFAHSTTVDPPPVVIPAPPLMQEAPHLIGLATSSTLVAAPPPPPPLPTPLMEMGDSGAPLPITPILTHLPASSGQQAAVAAVAPPLPATAFKAIEPAVLKNIDSALDMFAKPTSSTAQLSITMPSSTDNLNKKSVSVTKLELLTTSTTTTIAPKPAEKAKGVEIRILSSSAGSTADKPPAGIISVKKAANSSAGTISVVVQISSTKKPSTTTTTTATPKLMPSSSTTTTPSTIKLTLHKNGEKDMIRLKSKYGKTASVHDVIVVGEHVEGDDRLLDYDDHSDHHDEHERQQQHDNDDHGHHDSHGELKLEHKASEKKSSKSGSSSTKLIKIETKIKKTSEKEKYEDNEELQHHDHEHLLKGLLAGDVIHVDAGEPDKSSD